jgi:hypothetical protein
MGCVWSGTLSTATYRGRLDHPHEWLFINSLRYGCRLAFCSGAAPQQGDNSHDDHRVRNESKPNPEKPCPYASHLDAQHRLDSIALNRAGCTVRAALRRMLKHPLAAVGSQQSAVSTQPENYLHTKFCNERQHFENDSTCEFMLINLRSSLPFPQLSPIPAQAFLLLYFQVPASALLQG